MKAFATPGTQEVMASSRDCPVRGRAPSPRAGALTTDRFLLACLAAAAVAAPILVLSGVSSSADLPFAPAGALGALAAAVAAALAVALTLRLSRLRRASTARWMSTALALDVYAIGWGIRFNEHVASPTAASPIAELTARAAGAPLETFFFQFGACALVVASALGAATALFKRPYCLVCASRCRPRGDSVECAAPPLDEVRERLRARDWSFFRPLGPPSRRGFGLRFRLHSCRCGLTSCFDLVAFRLFWSHRVLAKSELLFPKEMRALREVTHDILHPPRAADWLVPTEARIYRAVGERPQQRCADPFRQRSAA